MKKDLKLNDLINLDEEQPKEEESLPEEKEEVFKQERPGRPKKEQLKKDSEAFFSFGMPEEDLALLRAFCTIKSKSIKDTIQEALKEYLAKPENQGTLNEAERLVKIIRKAK